MFLQNAWYVAAWGSEIDAGLVARTFLDQPVVLYRRPNGEPVALADRCCHRSLPLSMGTQIGDNLRCGYHGLVFDPSGQCIAVPGQAGIPTGARVRSYPVRERWQWVWIWMGDPALADDALIPNWWWMDHPEWSVVRGPVLHIEGNYQLVTDNLLDLSHLTYVHADTIGNDAVVRFPVRTERIDRGVRMSRLIPDAPPPPLYQKHGKFAGHVDRWQTVEATLPCYCDVDVGCTDVGTGAFEGRRIGGVQFHALSVATPETERTCFQFYAHPRHFALDDGEIDAMYRRDFLRVFKEDVRVMEAQQRNFDRDQDSAGHQSVDINVDAPSLAVRRLLTAAIEAEQAGTRPLSRIA
jgi:phenylpropionate dioxygenase-like ring-hydroxylating dioxygenase large terminal subunit